MPNQPIQRPKKIGLIGLYRCGNIGDEAIWRAFVQTMRPMLPEGSQIRLIAFGPGGFESDWIPCDETDADGFLHRMAMDDFSARRINLGFWLGRGAARFLRTLSGLDAVWYAGGHWIHDLSLKTLAGVMLPLVWARLKGANAGFVNVGAGPLESVLGKRLTAFAIGAKGPLVVRDEHSRQVLQGASLRRKAEVGRDTAFLLEPASDEVVDEWWSRIGAPKGKPTIGIVPCAWFKMAHLYSPRARLVQEMIDTLAAQARRMVEKNMTVALIPTMLPEDERVSERIIEQAGGGCFLVPTRRIPARVLMGLIGRLRALVSFRMHPVLFAYKMGTPFVALDYAPKLRSLVRDIGLERRLIPLDENWKERIEEAIDALLSDHDPMAGATPLAQLQQEARSGLEAAVRTLE